MTRRSHGLANRPGEPYPATFRIFHLQWTHRELNPDFQSAELVSSRWTMSPCVSSGPDGSRTHHTDLARVSRPQRHAGPSYCREVRPGIEPGLRPYHGRVLPEHLQTILWSDPGWNRTTHTRSFLLHVTQASSPLDHGIVAVTEVGVEPAKRHEALDLVALPSICVLGPK